MASIGHRGVCASTKCLIRMSSNPKVNGDRICYLCGFMWFPLTQVRGQCLHLNLGQPANLCLSVVLSAYLVWSLYAGLHVSLCSCVLFCAWWLTVSAASPRGLCEGSMSSLPSDPHIFIVPSTHDLPLSQCQSLDLAVTANCIRHTHAEVHDRSSTGEVESSLSTTALVCQAT